DLQVNGFGGIDFNGPDLTADRATEAVERMRVTGVTRCLPTLITSSFAQFARSARVLARTTSRAIAGIHMEGPYLSAEDGARGAHPREHVAPATPDDFNRRQDAAGGRIVLVTLAPEIPGALALIEHLVASGVRAAIGHTAADAQQIADAVTAGATLATHLGNGCAQMLPRHPNVIWELLAADAVCASLIADGHHLPPSTVKAMVRAKGALRTILVAYLVVITGIGLMVGYRVRRTAEYFLGERRFGPWVMIGQSLSVGTHAEMPVSLAGAVYTIGASAIWYQWKNLFITPLYWIMAPVFRRIRRTTMVEVTEDRYGSGMGAVYLVFALCFFIS